MNTNLLTGISEMLSTPCLVVMVGVSGSGKSTFAHGLSQLNDRRTVISYDALRVTLTGDEADQSRNQEVVALAHQAVATTLAEGWTAVVDGTHVDHAHRRPLLDIAAVYAVPAFAVVLATPLDFCLLNQYRRSRHVPDHIVRAQYSQLIDTFGSIRSEGFTDVLTRESWGIPDVSDLPGGGA